MPSSLPRHFFRSNHSHHDLIRSAVLQKRYVNALLHPYDQPLTNRRTALDKRWPYPTIVANVGATFAVGFGINAILRPDTALAFFDWETPTSPYCQKPRPQLDPLTRSEPDFRGCGHKYCGILWRPQDIRLNAHRRIINAAPSAHGAVCWNRGKGE